MESAPVSGRRNNAHRAAGAHSPAGAVRFCSAKKKEEEARELTDISTIKRCARRTAFRSPRIRQNFIVNPGICPKIAEAAGIDERFGVLEVGPGVGVLTKELARRAKSSGGGGGQASAAAVGGNSGRI